MTYSLIESPAFAAAAEMLADEQDESLIGRFISHYKVVAALGAGGMGEVYLAQDTGLDRQVALKLLPGYFTGDAERVRRFQQEARAASALNKGADELLEFEWVARTGDKSRTPVRHVRLRDDRPRFGLAAARIIDRRDASADYVEKGGV